MKKALALVLALVLALSLGVSAFAQVIYLDVEYPEYPDKNTIISLPEATVADPSDKSDNVYVAPAKGGEFYFSIGGYDGLKNVTVTTTGNVTAEIVKFDPKTMVFPATAGINFFVVDTGDTTVLPNQNSYAGCVLDSDIDSILAASGKYEGKDTKNDLKEYNKTEAAKTKPGYLKAASGETDWTNYNTANGLAGLLNNVEKAGRFVVKAFVLEDGKWNEVDLHLVKVTVGENYSASYKEGSFKVSAVDKATKYPVSYTATVISDVVIFEYNEVKWAAAQGELRAQYAGGYSDYETSFNGYKNVLGADYDYASLRNVPNATVVPTTAFRAIVGEDLVVCAGNDDDNYVVIYDVAKDQKGVNFAWHGFEYYNAEGKKITDGKEVGKTAEVKFGYYGKQTIASDFDVVITPGCDYTDLLKLFGLKVEEEDIVTYYVLKDGKAIGSFDIDYADVEEAYAPVQIKIEGKAGDTLGEYSVAIKAPVAPSEGEENPNTGAESVIGVVAAMAVVSVAAAAAVSLKK